MAGELVEARTSQVCDQLPVDEHEGVVVAADCEHLTRANVREARLHGRPCSVLKFVANTKSVSVWLLSSMRHTSLQIRCSSI